MRKRIVIGLVALVVGGGIAAFVLRSSEDPIEYHKRKFLEAGNGTGWTQRIRIFWQQRILRKSYVPLTDTTQLEVHREALRELGYLEQWQVVFTNRTPSDVMNVMATSTPPGFDRSHLHFYAFEISGTYTNVLKVLTVKGDIEKWKPYLIDSKDWRSPDSKAPGDRRSP